MKTLAILCASLLLLAQAATAQTAAPVFADYPALTASLQSTHKVLLQSPQSRRYATMIREAATHPPNFAGHYVLASFGCGASCVMAAAINAQDGTVIWLPFTVCCWPVEITEPLDFKPDSRLLIVHGSRNEKRSGTHYYVLDSASRKFHLLGSKLDK